MGKEIVTITGSLGSGKSVVGKAVAALLSAPYFSTGDLQRALAARKGMTTLELNRLAETEPAIDYEIDGLMQAYAERNDRCVVDSRLAWHFVPYSFKCYLEVHEKIGIERILGDARRKSEKYGSLEEAYKAVKGRKASEEKRFAALYDLDLRNMGNYDLVVDTSLARPDAIAGTVAECFRKWLSGEGFAKHWASPRVFFPTPGMRAGGVGAVRVSANGGFYFIVEGRIAVSEAIRQGVDLVAYEPAVGLAGSSKALIQEWEQAHGFKFFASPELKE